MSPWVRAAELLVVVSVLATSSCGSRSSTPTVPSAPQAKTLTLHAPADRDIATKSVSVGELVVCFTHGDRISGELPDASVAAGQVSGDDYASRHGGRMSISSDPRHVSITCR